jgi:hypothetical protein
MTNALALYAPAPAVARARAARGYPSLALEAHFAAMERRARMSRVAEIAEAPKPLPRPPLVLPPAQWSLMPLSAKAFAEAHAILDPLATYDQPAVPSPAMMIKREVCREWGIMYGDIVGPRRFVAISCARHVAMWLEKQTTEHSLPHIGRQFGDRDHSTVLHGVRVTAARMAADPAFRARVERLRERVEIELCAWQAGVAGGRGEGG